MSLFKWIWRAITPEPQTGKRNGLPVGGDTGTSDPIAPGVPPGAKTPTEGPPPGQLGGGNHMPDKDPLVFEDMKEREEAERKRLRNRKIELEQAKDRDNGLPEPLKTELTQLEGLIPVLDASEKDPPEKIVVVDPLYKAVQTLIETKERVGIHHNGLLPSQQKKPPDDTNDDEKAFAAVYGILERENRTNPGILVQYELRHDAAFRHQLHQTQDFDIKPDPGKSDVFRRFSRDLSNARGEYFASKALFQAVLPILVQEGDKAGQNCVRAKQWAAVTKILVAQGVTEKDIHLRMKTVQALESISGGGDGTSPSTIEIDLPDLEAQSDVEIQADNLHAMQAIYFAAMLEELKLFEVVEKLVELFHLGMLPLGKGDAGNFLYKYWKRSAERISEVERRSLYARAFGFPGGDVTQGSPNREFKDLWLRFVSAVSSFTRQSQVDRLLRSDIPAGVSQEHVRKAGRDLAANLSLHGYGIAYFVATEFQTQIKEFIDLLSDKDIKASYGARDMWQVIEQVSTLELGGARNSIRYRTMATAGAIIIRWLADRANILAGSTFVNVLNKNEISNPPPRPSGAKATTSPNDADLVNACEQWLAVTGTPEAQVEEYAQPVEGPMLTSSPVRIPTVAKDLLESVGIQAGIADANGHYHYAQRG